MRVLSQWSDVDIDYESSAFIINKMDKEKEEDEESYAILAYTAVKQFHMATYRNLEKAKKALHLMSSTYTRYLVTDHNDHMTMTDAIDYDLDKPFNKITISEMKATAFQFPEEDRI